MDSICRFVPSKSGGGDIKTVHFVYETEIKKLKQPFFRPLYYVNLVTKGNGVLKFNNTEFRLECGTLFIMFPSVFYEIEASDDFEYIYISFMGSYASTLLAEFKITLDNSVYYEFTHARLWHDAIQRITPANANILTESVLYYTLALIQSDHENCETNQKKQKLLEMIINYIDVHYREQDISLSKISGIFSYTEKYLSSFFRKNMNVKFTEYLNALRIQYAIELINQSEFNISEISAMCGYSDSLYFSKVFKRYMGSTPTDYIKLKNSQK
ncbi:MAG: helix-turn-helix transcriptional regulator [Clostridia bacterium]|nr:helix-turn-helix transcriptional regulator [Clostridia bacterium]